MKNLFNTLALFICIFTFAQNIPNAKTVTVDIAGNCGMCEKTIEAAANQAGVSFLDWDKSTKKATLTYDATQTSPEKVLKKVADAGYDNQYHKANKTAYNKLPGCCQYTRSKKATAAKIAEKSCGKKGEKKTCCANKDAKATKADAKTEKACDAKSGKACCTDKDANASKTTVKTKKTCDAKAGKACCADKTEAAAKK